MHISWLGNTAFKIQAKPFDKDVIIAIDPYKPETGDFPRSLTPNIGLYTRGEKGSVTLSGEPFILSSPGECETNGVLITSAQGHKANQTMLRIDVEGISVGHLGMTDKALTDKQLEVLSGVDILIVPVGGEGSYDAGQAVKAINTIEPRVIIPMAFQSDNNPKAKKVDSFLKEMGIPNDKEEKKVIIKKKDLPQDETKIIVLTKE
jgi:L-ascorbate metabolism protein UlaG (beta-lactamase superfamily)